MKKEIELINRNAHGHLRCRKVENFSHVADQYMVPVFAGEFIRACSEFPIVFIKDSVTGDYLSVGVLGLTEGENLIFNGSVVKSAYIPLDIARQPFYLSGKPGDGGELGLCVDVRSPLINTSKGEAFFNDDGEPGRIIDEIKAFFSNYVAKESEGRKFIGCLMEKGLLSAINLTLNLNGEKQVLGGLFKVDEDKLDGLGDTDIIDLHRRNYLQAIYAHIQSLRQFQKLIQARQDAAA